eukprot:gnl/MRDRNA2_/MRDRNA2_118487_c0_seq1.p1 gnl/MRDRNA2_/MRDRNA2_118487_c0~~gnl/MRDRNA2_/MRDRNA2_118487_c0_seq1.p1  ORF type:complete len:124 (-),score=20.33 gnl/MRDRNA2_/MRDRNA2_118487_c0_seq1:34-405(-)
MSRTGEIKNWNEDKGWGFIRDPDGGDDVFCHQTEFIYIRDSKGLGKGDKVRFDTKYDDRQRRERAINIELKDGGGQRRGRDSRDRGRGRRNDSGDRGRGKRDDSRDRGRGRVRKDSRSRSRGK